MLRFEDDGEAVLSSVHPGITVDEVIANTGWKLRVAAHITETPPPGEQELRTIREYDKERFWTGR
jgi:glutaconate CoA-transferase subunit B